MRGAVSLPERRGKSREFTRLRAARYAEASNLPVFALRATPWHAIYNLPVFALRATLTRTRHTRPRPYRGQHASRLVHPALPCAARTPYSGPSAVLRQAIWKVRRGGSRAGRWVQRASRRGIWGDGGCGPRRGAGVDSVPPHGTSPPAGANALRGLSNPPYRAASGAPLRGPSAALACIHPARRRGYVVGYIGRGYPPGLRPGLEKVVAARRLKIRAPIGAGWWGVTHRVARNHAGHHPRNRGIYR